MSRDLPGFYWDEAKNRYFPLSSRPAQPRPLPERPARPAPTMRISKSLGEDLSRKHRSIWNLSESLRSSVFTSRRSHYSQSIWFSQIASTTRHVKTRVPVYGSITAFRTTPHNGETFSFIGDDRGWIYSTTDQESGAQSSQAESSWVAEYNIQASEISSICLSSDRCIATSFGPACKIFVKPLFNIENPYRDIYVLHIDQATHDIWTSSMQGTSLVIGANKKAVYMSNVDVTGSLQMLNTHSDVFAVHHAQDNLIYTGARNGAIARFDMRIGKPRGQKLLEERFEGGRTSVLHLNIVREFQLLANHMNGDLQAFDLRFPRETAPLIAFPGHVNSLTRQLGFAVDPSENFVFAAGEDCRVRGWSLQSGEALHPADASHAAAERVTSSADRDARNPFGTVFQKPVTTMQVGDEAGETCLWAASHMTLYKYYLGQRAV